MRRLIYTAVFNGYDRVYPPIRPEVGVDYVLVTDDASLKVPGWQTFHVDTSSFATPKAANLYYRALIHRMFPEYVASLYVDGNIRILGPTRQLFEYFVQTGAAAMLYAHPQRQTVVEELEAVIGSGKLVDHTRARREIEDYFGDGFPDTVRLVETTIIFKNHCHPRLDEAMSLWVDLFQRYLSRDQLSFPYVIWKTGLDIALQPGTFREPNPYFALYPHYQAKNVNPWYVHVSARSHDSVSHWILLRLWQTSWALRRSLRRTGSLSK